MLAQHLCVQLATILKWLYFRQFNISHHKVLKVVPLKSLKNTKLYLLDKRFQVGSHPNATDILVTYYTKDKYSTGPFSHDTYR